MEQTFGSGTVAHLRGARILIVDDDPKMITFIQDVIALQAVEPLVAMSGDEAFARLAQEAGAGREVDIILLDVMLPGDDGFRILQRVKSDPRYQSIPVVMLTGLGSVQDKTRGLQLGADDYVIKPFDPQELLARLGVVMRIRRTEQMLRRRNQELAAINDINRMLSSSLELAEVLSTALLGLQSLVQALVYAIVLNDEETGTWTVRVARSRDKIWLEGRILKVNQGVMEEALRSHRPALRTAVTADPWIELMGRAPLDICCAPLVTRSGIEGLLVILGEPHTLQAELTDLLDHLAAALGVAVNNARLYEELSEFTAELERSQHQLVQAEKMAAVGRLTASIAHEINNPLQAIENSLHLALHPSLDEAQRRTYLELADQEVKRLVQIVVRMLDFYRPANNALQPININRCVADALALAHKKLQNSRIEVISRLSNDIPPVRGVANQLVQVFLNLIINAIEAMPDGGTLWVGSAYQAETGQVVIAFRDSGPGIPPEVRAHLFEPFHTTKPTGTGLGLTISYGIIERHQGMMEVESPPGGGATFIVKLPRAPEEDKGGAI